MYDKRKFLAAIIVFSLLVGLRYYLDKPYLKIINPKVESIFDESVTMAAFLFGETRKTMAAFLWGKVLDYHTEHSHATFYGDRKDHLDFKITENTLEELKDKIDITLLESLKDKVFSCQRLTWELRILKFNSRQIEIIQNASELPPDLYIIEGKHTLPLLRLITWLDNHFILAYDFGGYFLAVNQDKPREGVAFLKEGLKNNPDDYDLHQTLAFIYFHKIKNYGEAVKYGKLALKNAIKMKVTPQDIDNLKDKFSSDKIEILRNIEGQKFSRETLREILRKQEFTEEEIGIVLNYVTYEYTEDVKENCINSLRIIGHSYRKSGDMEHAKKYFMMILEIDPDLGPLVRNLLRLKPED